VPFGEHRIDAAQHVRRPLRQHLGGRHPQRDVGMMASANASWTASSATVRSPDQRASAATAGPRSRRKTLSGSPLKR
jgi:hypothetical protein